MFRSKLAIAFAATLLPGLALATNGYFLPGFGIKALGVGGAGIALQQDALSQAANPANLTQTGMRGDLGLSLFNPVRHSATGDATGLPKFDEDGDGQSDIGNFGFDRGDESGNVLYLLPDMAFSLPLSERLHLGFAMVGNGGMNTTYKNNPFGLGDRKILRGLAAHGGGLDLVGIDMMQIIAPISLAFKATPENSFGMSLNLAAQRFKANGLGQFVLFGISTDPKHLTNQGYDYAYGAGVRLGWLGKYLDDRVSVGATWSSKTYMTKWDKYRGLFAEQGDFDIPENYGIGLAIKPVKDFTVAFDVVKIKYSDVASVGNPGPGIDNGTGISQSVLLTEIARAGLTSLDPRGLGGDEGMGFGWKDTTAYKLGFIYDATDRLTLRAGYNYGRTPIRNDQLVFNALAPATVERHYSVGFTYAMQGELDWEISAAYMYAADKTQQGCANAVVDCVSFGMHQHILGIGFGVNYF